MRDPTQRFSSRVERYVKYRPTYPAHVLDILREGCGLSSDWIIGDIGSGTGLLTELFLRNGNRVFGVEPNQEMRRAGEQLLHKYPTFVSIVGTAEATTLPDRSLNLITAGQAFHWFDPERTRQEFARILCPGGWVALIWNIRQTEATPFMQDYQRLLQTFATEPELVDPTRGDGAEVVAFFGPSNSTMRSCPNRQVFNLEGLRGRLLSSSYTPENDHPSYKPMLQALDTLFQTHQVDGLVTFEYETKVYYGQIAP